MQLQAQEHSLFHAVGRKLRRPVPGSHRGYLAFGWLLVMLFFIQIVTGILLSFYYESSPEMAYESIRYIMRDVSSGWLVRGVHHWASHAMIALGLLQLLRVVLTRAYRGPNAPSWPIGLMLLALSFGFAFTGSLLVWDQTAYWSAVSALRWVETVPLFGPLCATILEGGQEVGPATLSRFYSIHTLILPWLAFYLLLLHLWLMSGRRVPLREEAPR